MTVTLWAHRYGVPFTVDISGDRWLRSFHIWYESDDHSIDGVEIDGEWMTREQVVALPEFKQIDEEFWQEYKQAQAEAPTTWVEVRHPNREREWARVDDSYADAVEVYGADRVRIASR